MDFADWIESEIARRGWSRSEAARRGGFSASMFDHVINQSVNPGLKFCQGISKAFGIPLEDVFRRAGILPPLNRDPTTGRAMWRYRAERAASDHPAFFLSRSGLPLDRSGLTHLLARLGRRADIHAYPHRFRHTFAIQFLRNGGNIYALQAMLGHTSLDMVKRYLHIVESDLEAAHRHASPVSNWNLKGV